MAGVFHKAMVWLGLAPDDEYDDYPPDVSARPGPNTSRATPATPATSSRPNTGDVQRLPGRGETRRAARSQPPPEPEPEPEDPFVSPRNRPTGVRQLSSSGRALQDDPRSSRADETPTVRPMRPTSAKPAVLSPESFDDAKEIADRFKADQPVVMDLTGLDRDLARRLVDFGSGICYALSGHMERVRPGGYLLTPAGVEVSDDERRRLASDGR
jgi:cell division inhibitor SepF